MKLYLLRPIDLGTDQINDLWKPWYDKAFGFVVRAETEEKARELASDRCGDEGRHAWLNSEYSTCIQLQEEGEEEVIIYEYAGA